MRTRFPPQHSDLLVFKLYLALLRGHLNRVLRPKGRNSEAYYCPQRPDVTHLQSPYPWGFNSGFPGSWKYTPSCLSPVDRLNLASMSGLREAVEIQMSPCSRVRVVIKLLPSDAADL